MMFFEDFVIGSREELGRFTFSVEAIKSFARLYDPQPFHIDEKAAAKSHFGGLIASGWHVAAIWMKLTIAHQERLQRQARAAGLPAASLGPSPGFRDMVWAKPVRPGDNLTYWLGVTGKKESASRPGWGIVMMRNEAINQRGELAFRFDGVVFCKRRPGPPDEK
jgi:acyl dehydratase